MQARNRLTISREKGMWPVVRFMTGTGIVVGITAALLTLVLMFGPYNKLLAAADSLSSQSEAISVALDQTSDTLDQVVDSMETAEQSLGELEAGLDDLDILLQSVSGFLGEEAPVTIESAQDAILSTQEGARAIDRVLRGLASVSFLTGVDYDPEQPLDASLAAVADSLSPLPQSLREVSGDLESVQANFGDFRESMVTMQVDLMNLRVELGGASRELSHNSEAAGRLAEQAADAGDRLRHWRIPIGLVLIFLTLNFSVIQWTIWRIAGERLVDIGIDETQPSSTGANDPQ